MQLDEILKRYQEKTLAFTSIERTVLQQDRNRDSVKKPNCTSLGAFTSKQITNTEGSTHGAVFLAFNNKINYGDQAWLHQAAEQQA